MAIELSDFALEAALARGSEKLSRPHAIAASYDGDTRLIEVVFNTEAHVSFDPHTVEDLKDIPEQAFQTVTVTPGGAGVIFGENFAFSLPGLLAKVLALHV